MIKYVIKGLALLALFLTLPVGAQTRAWLDRGSIYDGETVALNIETDQPLSQIDFSPLRATFEVGGQSVRRSYSWVNGKSTTLSVFSVGLRPRGQGVLSVPPLRVGNTHTQPLQLTVLPAPEPRAGASADVFVETEVDAAQPYVQQTVGVTVRLNYAVPLASGQLDLEPPAGASLQRVGEDLTYRRNIGGRSFQTVERRFLLIPERSGVLLLPGARFNGARAAGFFDQFSNAADIGLAAAAPAQRLQVRPIPMGAPQPWLPLHQLTLRYLQAPKQAWAGQAATIEVEAVADGATAAQMPEIMLSEQDGVQVFADPPRVEEQFDNGRPRAVLRRKFSIVPQRPGTLQLQGARVAWWNAEKGQASVAELPVLRLEVAPGAVGQAVPAVAQPAPNIAVQASEKIAPAASQGASDGLKDWWLAGLGVLLVIGVGYALQHMVARPRPAAAVQLPTLAQALQQGDLGGISAALTTALGVPEGRLEAVAAALPDAQQRRAVELLQAARWGTAAPDAALALLRQAFSTGVKRNKTKQRASSLLPPLYPE